MGFRRTLARWLAADDKAAGRKVRLSDPLMKPATIDTYGTYPANGLTPERIAKILKLADAGETGEQAELFQQIEERDQRIAGTLQTRRTAITSLPWEIKLPDEKYRTSDRDARQAEEIADACTLALSEMVGFRSSLADLLDAVGQGFAGTEILWDLVGKGEYWPRELRWVNPVRFNWYERTGGGANELVFLGRPRLLTEESPLDGIELPSYKFVIHRARHRAGYPNKAGLLRSLTWFYLFKNYSVKDWAIVLERLGTPMRIGKVPPGTKGEDRQELLEALAQLGTDSYAVIREDAAIEITRAVERGSLPMGELIAYIDREITVAVLGHAGSAEGTPGKLGNEKQAGDLRQDLLESDAALLSESITRDLIEPFVHLNFGNEAPAPQFQLQSKPAIDLQAEAQKDERLLKLGIPVSLRSLRDKYGLPEPEDDTDEFIVQQQTSPGPPGQMASQQQHDVITASAVQQRKLVDRILDGQKKRASVPTPASSERSDGRLTLGAHWALRKPSK